MQFLYQCVLLSIALALAQGFRALPKFSVSGFTNSLQAATEKVDRLEVIPELDYKNFVSSQGLVDVTDADFEENVLSGGCAVILFGSDWCGPCKTQKASIMEVSGKFAGVKYFQIDCDYNPEAAAEFNIRSLPTTLIFRDGRVVSEIIGAVPSSMVGTQISKNQQ